MRWKSTATLFSFILACATPAHSACSARSGTAHPHLVELYTSEGCDSCPPAERWMSSLLGHHDLIGLEFHVDYWDTSDWRDPFSRHAYTLRQQALAKRGNHDQVYTPQIWLDGRIWRNWPKGSPPALVAGEPPSLRMTVEPGDTLHVSVDAGIAGNAANYRIFAALTENGLSEYVRGGENHGKTLRHDSVVRAFAGPFDAPHAETDIEVPSRVERGKTALVAFVDDRRDGDVVQALRLPLAECKR